MSAMVSRTTVLLVLLHLHASDTLREDLRKDKSTIQIPDEDLLDLMVRIAESPAEWERMHRVLSLLGDEKYNSGADTGSEDKTELTKPLEVKSSPKEHVNSKPPNIAHDLKTNITKIPLDIINYQNDQTSTQKNVEIDTGWPDFNEAILKKVNKTNSFGENYALENNWLKEDWFDNNWSDYLNAQNDHEELLRTSTRNNPPVRFVPSKESKYRDKNFTLNTQNNSKTKLQSPKENLIFDTPSNVSNISLEESKGEKPIFLYHRVTLGPQEKKGSNAFIAVSVVKQTNIDSTAGTSSPLNTMKSDSWRHLYRIQESSNTRNDQKTNHQHRKGQRRHHAHTHIHNNH